MQPPARDLAEALERMTWEVLDGPFALVGSDRPPAPEDLASLGEGPWQVVREGGETTFLGPQGALAGLLARHPGARVERELAWIRFRAPMGWEVVGFLAEVTGRLARAGVPLGAVCGWSRDHLFLARRHLPAARAVLEDLLGPPFAGTAGAEGAAR